MARLVAVMVERNAHLSPEFDRGSLASWIKAQTRYSGRSAHRPTPPRTPPPAQDAAPGTDSTWTLHDRQEQLLHAA
jgi:hypothetical protein